MHRAKDNLDVAMRENSVISLEKGYERTYEGFDPKSSESYIMFEILQSGNMEKSVELARLIQRSVCSKANRNDKGVHQAGFLVLRETSMPSCLIELGFITSEEEEQFVPAGDQGRYLVLFDPLDGSSNIDINISVGTIFSILEKPAGPLSAQSFLQSGRAQVASGYALYGPQTQLVLCLRHGVAVFTLDAGGQFVQTQLNPQIPQATREFAINMSNQRHWQPPMQQYIAELLAGETGPRGKNYNMRWVASMVAEIHRILMRGGIFMYPKDARDPAKPGKLRLMYEANPLSLIIEQAGGAATNARENMLDIQPEGLHQRVAVIMGSREEVDYATRLHQQ